MRAHILIVDDDETIRISLGEALDDSTTEVATAESAEKALSLLDNGLPDVVLSDIRMPGLDGIELLRTLRERAPMVDVVLMTAYDDMPTVVSAMREGAADFLSKPIDLHELPDLLHERMEDLSDVDRGAENTADTCHDFLLPCKLKGSRPLH